MSIEVLHGDCVEQMALLIERGVMVDSIVTDPPYELAFMSKKWDATGIANSVVMWQLALSLLKPGGMLAAFGGTRTHHRMACAIEDAGFEIRDCIMWLYGTGFPKSRSMLKPAYEPIILARKPGPLRPLDIDGCRVDIVGDRRSPCGADGVQHRTTGAVYGKHGPNSEFDTSQGRWPANVIHDGSDEVLEAFARFGSKRSAGIYPSDSTTCNNSIYGKMNGKQGALYSDSGSAARFFYSAKASKLDRCNSNHPTVKPLSLMKYLCRLITLPDGTILDPFAGSGTTLAAAHMEGFNAIGIERESEYIDDIRRRIAALTEAPQPARQGGLFDAKEAAE